jgi:hypothetical protein
MLLLTLAESINNLILAFVPAFFLLFIFVFGLYYYEGRKQNKHK